MTATADRGLGVARHRVVIIGAGFGGLLATRALRRAPVEVTVVDRTNHHLFQPLLYQAATGVLSEGDIAPPIREVLRNQRNTRMLLGEVVDIDLGAHEVMLETIGQRTRIPYDSVIAAAGAGQSYFGHDEFAVYAPGMKTIDDALELRGRIFEAFEMAELESEPTQRDAWLTFVVVGAGPTGVELAGQIAELSHRALQRNYRTLDPKSARIILIEATDTVLPPFPKPLRHRAQHDLERLGVEVRLRTLVTGVDPSGLDVKQQDQSTGRIEASLDHLPGVAEVAMQSGIHAARTITRRLSADTGQRPFRYRDLGTMATIAQFRAVVFIGRIRVTGPAAWLLWLVVHLAFLTGYTNRLAAVANWAIAFLGHNRRQRTITEQQVFARTREVKQPEAGVPDRAFLEWPSGRGCR
jgi:NADH:ubiquinone reductase (H+-translocating)